MNHNYTLSIAFALCITSLCLNAQNSGFIYGKVTAWDGKTYTGQIRWDKEEAFWTDMFNAGKLENEYIDLLSRDDFTKLREGRQESNEWWDRMTVRYISSGNYTHQFGCQFGFLKSVKQMGNSRIEIELRDGKRLRLNGSGYNDVGAAIRVYVPSLGKVELSWEDVEIVEFMSAPSNFESAIGAPLYGTVETWNGTYTGIIHWDKDERVGTDILDGEDQGREMEIEFANIASIKKRGRGSQVTLKSGDSYFLDEINDVDKGNRGIVVTNETLGRVEISWEDFDQVSFSPAPNNLKSYGSFETPKEISGTVTTAEGKQVSGRIAYDLDESFNYELLDGSQDGTEFQIPFSNIKQIKPRNSNRSQIILKNGETIVLGDSQDVCCRHTGVLVFVNENEDPVYITWTDVDVIDFN